ncbi:MAG: SpoIID/LytB domain-containing protein [bacterium]
MPTGLISASLLCLAAAAFNPDLPRFMQGRTGAVVVLDARTGAVLAEHPRGAARQTFARPGSVVKPFTLEALIRSGRFKPEASLSCPGRVRIGGHQLDCSHPAGTPLDAEAALAYSCNHYFTTMARRLSPPELARALQPAGRVTAAGTPDELALQAVGEARIEVTPYDLARAWRSLALRVARSPELKPVLLGLEGCVRYGTGRLAAVPGLEIAGKTGTGTAGNGGYTHAWFAGFAPSRDPRIVVAVYLERGQGGADAAPVAREVFRAWARSQGSATPAQKPPPAAPAPAAGYKIRLHWASRRDGEIITLSPEEYVAAVLAGEATVLDSTEALKAMAVAARTYAHRFRGRHSAEGFDFCDTTHCQDVRLAAVTERVRAAARATEGEILWYEGRPAAAYYHANCGGVTEADAAGPYLARREDPFCPRLDWSATLSVRDIARALAAAGFRVTDEAGGFEIASRTASGRAETVRFGALRLPASAFNTAIGQALGWNLLRSTRYEARDGGSAVEFRGRGAGHGIGLCQAGARAMGAAGRSYREILAWYYPGTTVSRGASGFRWTRLIGERSEVWTTRPGADAGLPALADKAVAEAEQRSRIRVGRRPQFRFYPTVAAFRDATPFGGNAAGVTRDGIVHMQPASVLRSAGTLERTLLHEALHVAIESRAREGLPAWFREGLVEYLSERDPRSRVARLVAQRGLDLVLGWLETGLPEDVD